MKVCRVPTNIRLWGILATTGSDSETPGSGVLWTTDAPVDLFEAEIRALSPEIATKSSFEPEGSNVQRSQMTRVPDIAWARLGGCEDIKHVLDIPATCNSIAHF